MTVPRHNADRVLVGFVALSAALHLAVLASWGRPEPPHRLGDTLLAVRLEQPAVHTLPAPRTTGKQQAPSRVSRNKPASETPVAKDRHPPREAPSCDKTPIGSGAAPARHTAMAKPGAPAPERSPPPAAPVTEALETAPDHPSANPNPPGTDPEPSEDTGPRILAQLHLDLARHFSYPLLARRRGWQGEVILALRVEADGRISNTRIARSSGYGTLDRAALESLSRLPPLETAARLLNGRRLDLQLPVIYRLKEG